MRNLQNNKIITAISEVLDSLYQKKFYGKLEIVLHQGEIKQVEYSSKGINPEQILSFSESLRTLDELKNKIDSQ